VVNTFEFLVVSTVPDPVVWVLSKWNDSFGEDVHLESDTHFHRGATPPRIEYWSDAES
jgi:hypothetical protein